MQLTDFRQVRHVLRAKSFELGTGQRDTLPCLMKAWPIDSRVNSPKNNDAEIVVPVEIQSVARPEDSQQPQLL
jgi:hypothetical protein